MAIIYSYWIGIHQLYMTYLSNNSHKRGVTLIELIIYVSLFSILVSALSLFNVRSFQNNIQDQTLLLGEIDHALVMRPLIKPQL